MRTALFVIVLCLGLLALSIPADAETVGVGDCKKFSGGCAAVCVDITTGCWNDGLVCAGMSYQLPLCVGTGGSISLP